MKNCNRLKTLTRCLYSSYYTGVNCPNSITFNFVMFQSLLCLQDLPLLLTATSLLIAIATISVAVREAEAGQSSIYATAVQSVNKLRVKNEYFSILIISTPIKTGSQATQTKAQERTIDDPEFYALFFKAIEKELRHVSGSKMTKLITAL